ncbi:RNA polymerase sigma factor [Sunxiuqinia indica]|uniref:RNA polymerase sigma factor n=1 Tax=Sunxiuqinia indica TaxID=2692584 RepID=UPI001357454E|nr:RNA polymerase sigma factor [Sunxiuqinia indica]
MENIKIYPSFTTQIAQKVDNRLDKNIEGSQWQEVWDKFKKGDRKAFDTIYYEHVDFLFSYGRKLTTNSDLVEDAIQDLFLYILSKREQIITPNFIRYYLLRAYKRILLEKVKREKSDNSDLESGKFGFNFYLEVDALHEKKIEEKKIELIESLINQLDSQKKEVIFLKFYSGLRYAEIADIVGIKPSSVKKLVYRTISSFREIVKDKAIELFVLFSKIAKN